MRYEHLLIESREAADWVTLNRPEQLNTLNPQLLRELNDYFAGLERNYAVRVVVLRGAGRAFCAGLDMKANGGTPLDAGADAMLRSQREFSGLVMRMRRCPQPVIGLLHGHAAGGGFSIALGCDVRIAAAGTKMNCAFIKIGLSGCEMGASYHLPRLVGTSVAAELLYTGRFIDAERALRVGLVSEVVPADQLEAAGEALAQDMPAQFDAVTCMEMLEHVPDPTAILRACAALVKPGGMVFFSTINRNPKAFLFAIVGAEHVLNLLPKGTHEYARFIKPSELARWSREAGLELVESQGMEYNPVTRRYWLSTDTSVNYLLALRRPA